MEPKKWIFDVIPVPARLRTALFAVDHNADGRNSQFRPKAKN